MNLQEYTSSPPEKQQEILDATAYAMVMTMPMHALMDLVTAVTSKILTTLPVEYQYQLLAAPDNELRDLFLELIKDGLEGTADNA
jgi:hypothetical protein